MLYEIVAINPENNTIIKTAINASDAPIPF